MDCKRKASISIPDDSTSEDASEFDDDEIEFLTSEDEHMIEFDDGIESCTSDEEEEEQESRHFSDENIAAEVRFMDYYIPSWRFIAAMQGEDMYQILDQLRSMCSRF
jgi:hypothetical protein